MNPGSRPTHEEAPHPPKRGRETPRGEGHDHKNENWNLDEGDMTDPGDIVRIFTESTFTAPGSQPKPLTIARLREALAILNDPDQPAPPPMTITLFEVEAMRIDEDEPA